ncbi:hypothetical protein [Mangrovitalea sediminis]|uniref:hypothetical protein n=1 Tax=Mangrovitalea sediminis TaxID=1982043 RepID=UPI000BE52342|nr:hypothetical protein [Mangrovitalea sediminis]
MPQNLPLALVIVGAILLLIALLGGQFKLFGAEVPGKVGQASRWMSGFAGVILIVMGIYLGSGALPPFPSTQTPSTQSSEQQPSSAQPAEPDTTPQPPKTIPPARAPDPDALFIETAKWPHSDDGRLSDSRVREAVVLALHGENIPQARRLLAEAGFPDGLSVDLPMRPFITAGGSNDDIQRIRRRLVQVGIRLELRD